MGFGGFALAALLASVVSSASPALPNLSQEPPSGLDVAQVAGRWHLGFTSAVDNVGAGELLVRGSRSRRAVSAMTAYQYAGTTRLGRVGTIRFEANLTHHHWHLLPFEAYELRRAGDGALVTTARKAGFCLTDTRRLNGTRKAKHTAFCGKNRPDLLLIGEGISPGWGDLYGPEREGQFVDVTGLPAGGYLVVNRVNAGRAIRETRYDDDVAATAFDLEWPDGLSGEPTFTITGTCTGAAVCATLKIP
jgi:hypothetical protein